MGYLIFDLVCLALVAVIQAYRVAREISLERRRRRNWDAHCDRIVAAMLDREF